MSKKVCCLRKIDLYCGINDDDFCAVAKDADDLSYEGDIELYQEGEEKGHIYIIKEGEVELYRIQHGKKIILQTLFPGDVFGNFGLEKYSHNAITTRKSYLCKTPTNQFLKVVQEFPEIMFRLMQVMAERTEYYESKIALMSAPAKEQLLETIKNLYEKNSKRFLRRIIKLPFKISHEQLSKKTGLNRVTVSKLMKELEREGKIFVNSKTREIRV